MTPRKEEVPREKPWLWRRTAMMSSSKLMLSMHSVRSAYLCQHGVPGFQGPALNISCSGIYVLNLAHRVYTLTHGVGNTNRR